MFRRSIGGPPGAKVTLQPRRGQVVGLALLSLALLSGCAPLARVRARLELKNGNERYLEHDYKGAIGHYDTALRYVPNNPRVLLSRAWAHEALFNAASGDDRRRLADEAIRSLRAYLTARAAKTSKPESGEPTPDRIEQHIVSLYLGTQQTDEAVQFLSAKLEKDPHDAVTLQMLAALEAERGHLEAALGWHRKRVEAEPRSPEVRHAMGAFIWQMSYRDPMMDPAKRQALLDEASVVLQEAIALRPQYADALVYLNLIWRQKAQYAATEAERSSYMAQAKAAFDRASALRAAATAGGLVDSTGAPIAGSPAAPIP